MPSSQPCSAPVPQGSTTARRLAEFVPKIRRSRRADWTFERGRLTVPAAATVTRGRPRTLFAGAQIDCSALARFMAVPAYRSITHDFKRRCKRRALRVRHPTCVDSSRHVWNRTTEAREHGFTWVSTTPSVGRGGPRSVNRPTLGDGRQCGHYDCVGVVGSIWQTGALTLTDRVSLFNLFWRMDGKLRFISTPVHPASGDELADAMPTNDEKSTAATLSPRIAHRRNGTLRAALVYAPNSISSTLQREPLYCVETRLLSRFSASTSSPRGTSVPSA